MRLESWKNGIIHMYYYEKLYQIKYAWSH